MSMMWPPFHAIKIAEHYPEIIVISIHDEKTDLYNAAVCVRNPYTGKPTDETLYMFPSYAFLSDEQAVATMSRKVVRYLDAVRVMSN